MPSNSRLYKQNQAAATVGNRRRVQIDEVNVAQNVVTGVDYDGLTFQITFGPYHEAGVITVPKQGENWIIEQYKQEWKLKHKVEDLSQYPNLSPGDKVLSADTFWVTVSSNTFMINGNAEIDDGYLTIADPIEPQHAATKNYVDTHGGAGLDGLDGSTGPIGPQGLQGLDGLEGSTGPMGPIGPPGVDGLDGSTGSIGPLGPQGIPGIDGIDGKQGPSGLDGLEGSTGPIGPLGPQGLDGLEGSTGPLGPQGIQGVQGNDGLEGSTGPIGPQGIQGIQGVAGNDGLDGSTGPTGPIGPQGLDGLEGPTGPTGAIGLQGNDGLEGSTGPIGPIGLQGLDGLEGIGFPGPQGLDGLDGNPLPAPRITSSAMSGGPPASPNDGDIWIATFVGSSGQAWQFRYNGVSEPTYKWEFIGGSEVMTNTATGNKGGGSAWTDIAQLTIPRAGDYTLRGGMWAAGPTGGAATHELGFGLNSTTTVFATGAATVNSSASYDFTMHTEALITGLTASEPVYLNLWSNGAAASVTPSWVWFSIIPVRVS